MDDARRSTVLDLAACAAVGAGLWLLFGVILEPTPSDSCNTSLLDGPYKSAMLPAHALAAAVLSWLIWRRRTPRTAKLLAAAWVAVVVCVAIPPALGVVVLVAIFAAPVLGLGLVCGLLASPDRVAPLLPWAGLLVGLPASAGYAWLAGANPFCF